ncbi:MAG: hypothetical protein HOH43_11125 [Candidatus Latescibacteria bacterium]|nr:hypothetical protein [Candidatus Latescibacterota bacterium]
MTISTALTWLMVLLRSKMTDATITETDAARRWALRVILREEWKTIGGIHWWSRYLSDLVGGESGYSVS